MYTSSETWDQREIPPQKSRKQLPPQSDYSPSSRKSLERRDALSLMLRLQSKRLTALVQTSVGNHSLILQTCSPHRLRCLSSSPAGPACHSRLVDLSIAPHLSSSHQASFSSSHSEVAWFLMENRGRGYLLKNLTLSSVMQRLNWFISSGGETSFTENWVYSSHFYLNFCDMHILISTSYQYYSISNRSTLLKKFKRCVFPIAYKCQWVCRVGSIGPLLPSSGLLVYPLDSWGEAVDCQVGANIHWGEFQRYNCVTGISKNKSNMKGQLLQVLHHTWTLKRQIAKKQRGGAWWSLEALGEEGFTMVPQSSETRGTAHSLQRGGQVGVAEDYYK